LAYGPYQQRGYFIGSGAIESAGKQLTAGTRDALECPRPQCAPRLTLCVSGTLLIQCIRKEFPLQAPHIVYRYCEPLAAKAREIVSKHYRQFVAYYGKALIRYPDSRSMAADMRKFYRYQVDRRI